MYSNGNVQKLSSLEKYKNNFSSNTTNLILKSEFLNKLIDSQKQYNWIDIEKRYYSTIINIYQKFLDYPQKAGSHLDELKKLNQDFEFIRIKLEEYLILIQNEDIQKLNPNFDEGFGKVFHDNFIEKFMLGGSVNLITFLNFNYTNTIEKYIKYANGRGALNYSLNYIHGKLENTQNPIIFGFGDETDEYYKKIEELNINEFLNNFKSFGYFKTNNYQNLLSIIESKPFDVDILGHSCGLSDRVLLNTVFEHGNCEAIKIHYYENINGENNFTFKTQEISRHFNDGVKSKAKMRKRIVNFHDCQPLKV